ncbi:CYTH domain-containing protein [Bacillus carboniphilus]|uniref:CYTH domain-containing protein n=1 Tax=Bacillus carboniphilus TaxID=86663 RepID=A0ABY9JU75_9BACI|nr:CYTH domain-containing protein [Bacillus carboniphilus]WLR42954.1 CYTH domain-containing protein [Bacillus carboniphilus]
MTQEIEIEFKNMLTEKEYKLLLENYKINTEQIFKQTNYYFDTQDFLLKQHGIALRIRKKNDIYQWTLKQPYQDGLLETHQPLSNEEFEQAIQSNVKKEGPVFDQLKELSLINQELICLGSLITFRTEKKLKNGLIVLDYSRYLNKEDFELEFEVKDYGQGKVDFHSLLSKHRIPARPTKNKIQRFYEAKY